MLTLVKLRCQKEKERILRTAFYIWDFFLWIFLWFQKFFSMFKDVDVREGGSFKFILDHFSSFTTNTAFLWNFQFQKKNWCILRGVGTVFFVGCQHLFPLTIYGLLRVNPDPKTYVMSFAAPVVVECMKVYTPWTCYLSTYLPTYCFSGTSTVLVLIPSGLVSIFFFSCQLSPTLHESLFKIFFSFHWKFHSHSLRACCFFFEKIACAMRGNIFFFACISLHTHIRRIEKKCIDRIIHRLRERRSSIEKKKIFCLIFFSSQSWCNTLGCRGGDGVSMMFLLLLLLVAMVVLLDQPDIDKVITKISTYIHHPC